MKLPFSTFHVLNRQKMAEPAPGVVAQSTRFVRELLTGQHALSKLIPVALWLADAVGTSLIIWKVPCALRAMSQSPGQS